MRDAKSVIRLKLCLLGSTMMAFIRIRQEEEGEEEDNIFDRAAALQMESTKVRTTLASEVSIAMAKKKIIIITIGSDRFGYVFSFFLLFLGFSQRPIDLNHTKKSADPFGTGRTAERIYPPRPSYAVEPGARAQDVGAAKAGVLRLPQMLDGTPIGPRSAVSKSGGGGGSRTSMFVENMVELEARVSTVG